MLGQHELKPGESTELKIVYNTYKFPGAFEKFVYIDLGGEDKAREVISLHGEVDPIPMGVLEVSPRKLEAGSMSLDKPVELEIDIRNSGDAPLSVLKVLSQKSGKQYFPEGADGKMIINPGQGAKVKISLLATQKGRFMDFIMIHADARNVTDMGYKVVVVGQCE